MAKLAYRKTMSSWVSPSSARRGRSHARATASLRQASRSRSTRPNCSGSCQCRGGRVRGRGGRARYCCGRRFRRRKFVAGVAIMPNRVIIVGHARTERAFKPCRRTKLARCMASPLEIFPDIESVEPQCLEITSDIVACVSSEPGRFSVHSCSALSASASFSGLKCVWPSPTRMRERTAGPTASALSHAFLKVRSAASYLPSRIAILPSGELPRERRGCPWRNPMFRRTRSSLSGNAPGRHKRPQRDAELGLHHGLARQRRSSAFRRRDQRFHGRLSTHREPPTVRKRNMLLTKSTVRSAVTCAALRPCAARSRRRGRQREGGKPPSHHEPDRSRTAMAASRFWRRAASRWRSSSVGHAKHAREDLQLGALLAIRFFCERRQRAAPGRPAARATAEGTRAPVRWRAARHRR